MTDAQAEEADASRAGENKDSRHLVETLERFHDLRSEDLEETLERYQSSNPQASLELSGQ